MPPLSGFFAKLMLVQAGLEMQHYVIVATALAVGLLTLISMTKIWAEAFWKPSPDAANASGGATPNVWSEAGASSRLLLVPTVSLAVVTVLIGLAVGPVYLLASRAAEQLMDPAEYIRVVMGRS
jgi:multicomponent Na+:H+ antiporter subunit D